MNEHEHLNIPDLARLIFTCSPWRGTTKCTKALYLTVLWKQFDRSADLQFFSYVQIT